MMMTGLLTEWERVETLADIVQESRTTQKISDNHIDTLKRLQHDVLKSRDAGAWDSLVKTPMAAMEYDILACALAPVLSPRTAWMYQTLQGRKDSPFPSLHFLQELLSLGVQDVPELHASIGPASGLQQQNLIKTETKGVFTTITPTARATHHVLGTQLDSTPPPGTHRVSQTAHWDELILPDSQIVRLKEFLSYIRYRDLIIQEWGGRPSPGPVALFSGSSGTGKTFAASVLATELGWPLYRVDLGRLVSKYIGETEKNLNALFDAAHGQDMILQFDEADALFSKRGEVKEARDRYANLEVSHLLTRIESHRGPCILTSNLRDQMDIAFARRFQIVVDFPRPDAKAREALWQRALPPRAPTDDTIDLKTVANSVKMNGGSIHNAAHHAAVMAAHAEENLSQRHITHAIWRELGKEGRPISLNEIGALAPFLKRRKT